MKIAIIGSSGWLAHYLIREFKVNSPTYEIFGFSNATPPAEQIFNHILSDKSRTFLVDTILKLRPHIVVNCARTHSLETDELINSSLAQACSNADLKYLLFSTAAVYDGSHYVGPISEIQEPRARSEYGCSKIACENEVKKQGGRHLIIRFPAIHGFAPNRKGRTVSFLERLAKKEEILVPAGIMQNRIYAGYLVKQIHSLIHNKAYGTYHLGGADASEELDFLKKLAVSFGFSDKLLVMSGRKIMNLYLSTDKLTDTLPSQRYQETQSLNAVAKSAELRFLQENVRTKM